METETRTAAHGLLISRLQFIVETLIDDFPYREVLRLYEVPAEKRPTYVSLTATAEQRAELEVHLRHMVLRRLEGVVLGTLEGTGWVGVPDAGSDAGSDAGDAGSWVGVGSDLGEEASQAVVVAGMEESAARAAAEEERAQDARGVAGAKDVAVVAGSAASSLTALVSTADALSVAVGESLFVRSALAATVGVLTGVLPALIVASCNSKEDVAAISAASAAALGLYLGGVVSGPAAVGSTAAVAAYRTATWGTRVVAQAKANVEAELALATRSKAAIARAFAEAFVAELAADDVRFARLAMLIVRRQRALAAERDALAAMPALSDSWLLIDYDDIVDVPPLRPLALPDHTGSSLAPPRLAGPDALHSLQHPSAPSPPPLASAPPPPSSAQPLPSAPPL